MDKSYTTTPGENYCGWCGRRKICGYKWCYIGHRLHRWLFNKKIKEVVVPLTNREIAEIEWEILNTAFNFFILPLFIGIILAMVIGVWILLK